MISIDNVLAERLPLLSVKHPVLNKSLSNILKYLFHEREFHSFQEKYPHVEGIDFVEQVLEYFDFNYRVFDRELERIPKTGRLVITANHPIGSLDGLALLKMVADIRPDVKVIANEVLYAIEPLRSLLLPVDNLSRKTARENIRNIRQQLEDDGVIILFPAGEVSRLSPKGIKDGRWDSGFLRFAHATNSPILPLHINGRNSLFFYAISMISKPLSGIFLVREMFKQANQHIDIRVGHQVYPQQYRELDVNNRAKAKLFKKEVYRLGKGKSRLGFMPEFEAVAHPEDTQLLKDEIRQCEMLGQTQDGKNIYLYRYRTNSVVLREIGRLRELTFRAVKEGTGKKRDIDSYDSYYDHIILWDETELEIVGSYRMVQTAKALSMEVPIRPGAGIARHQLYTQSLFDYQPSFTPLLDNALELGRSFIQPKYWGRRSLDYLWFGIGAYLKKYPEIKTLYGPVSISQAYSDSAKDLLVFFYGRFFAAKNNVVASPQSYQPCQSEVERFEALFSDCHDYRQRFTLLKKLMQDMNEVVPTLYKQYCELCDEGGTEFVCFNIDADFNDCIDGFMLVNVDKIKKTKRDRYIGAD